MSVHPSARISPHARIYTNKLSVGKMSRIDDGVILTGDIEIGDYCHIAAYVVLTGSEGITIGDYSSISMYSNVLTGSDDFSGKSMMGPTIPDDYRPGLKKGAVILGRNVVVGAHSMIMPGVHLYDGCAIGAFSFVKETCDSNSIYAGVPAKFIKARHLDMWRFSHQLEDQNMVAA